MKFFTAASALLVAFAVAACDPHDWNDPHRGHDDAVETARAETPEACAAGGGDWRPVCMAQAPACVTPYPDAGETCSDSADCLGDCVADSRVACDDNGENCRTPELPDMGARMTGICQINDDPCGVFTVIEDGVAGVSIAVD